MGAYQSSTPCVCPERSNDNCQGNWPICGKSCISYGQYITFIKSTYRGKIGTCASFFSVRSIGGKLVATNELRMELCASDSMHNILLPRNVTFPRRIRITIGDESADLSTISIIRAHAARTWTEDPLKAYPPASHPSAAHPSAAHPSAAHPSAVNPLANTSNSSMSSNCKPIYTQLGFSRPWRNRSCRIKTSERHFIRHTIIPSRPIQTRSIRRSCLPSRFIRCRFFKGPCFSEGQPSR
jgi:hypothetical protein